MRNLFCVVGIIGVILFIAGHYFIDHGTTAYILGIILMTTGFAGLKKT